MKVSFQAFSINCTAKSLPIDTFFDKLSSDTHFSSGTRRIYTIKLKDFYAGLVLTIKDMRKFCKIVSEKGTIRITEHKLDANESMTEFNFFILNPKHHVGMFQYYHHSCSLNSLLGVSLKKKYGSYQQEMFTEKKEQLELDGYSAKAMKKELEPFRGRMSYSIIERQGSFEDRIRKMREISSIEFETIEPLEKLFSGFSAISNDINKQRHTLSFKAEARRERRLRDTVAEFVGKKKPVRAVAKGEDEHGAETVYKLLNDFDSFATYDYDNLVPSLMLDQANIHSSISKNKIVSELLSEYNKRNKYFSGI